MCSERGTKYSHTLFKTFSKVKDLIIPDIHEPVTIQVRGISLMRSEFGKNGMIYTEIGYVDGSGRE